MVSSFREERRGEERRGGETERGETKKWTDRKRLTKVGRGELDWNYSFIVSRVVFVCVVFCEFE